MDDRDISSAPTCDGEGGTDRRLALAPGIFRLADTNKVLAGANNAIRKVARISPSTDTRRSRQVIGTKRTSMVEDGTILLVVVGISVVVGFVTGYAVRAAMSARRRKRRKAYTRPR